MHADLIIRGGLLVDGTGSEPSRADVAVLDGKIVAIGELAEATADRLIDATERIVAPGFIDLHTHSDMSLLLDPQGESKILQGVTTEVTGNCGFSPFPIAADRLDLHADHLARIGDDPYQITWSDLDGYAAILERQGVAVNVAPLVGHGTVRCAVLGVDQREATSEELARMQELVAESLEQGAFGLSTGLTHIPSGYGSPAEVTELVRVVGRYDAMYATHSRATRSDEGFPSVQEAIDTCLAAGARLQYSHAAINEPDKWGQSADVTALFEKAEADGLDVKFDVYPYDASSSSLTQYLPTWVQEGGTEGMRRLLEDPSVRARAEVELAAGWMGGIPWFWDRIVLSRTGEGYEDHVGLSIEAAAARAGLPPEAYTLDLCLALGNTVQVVLFYRTEEDMTHFLSHRLALVGSDGSAIPLAQEGKKPHPRHFGSFPRILGRYVRDAELMPLATAIYKMTAGVAERLQLTDRGTVEVGLAADLVVLDPATVIDRATFTDPAQAPQGIETVIVNGQVVVSDGIPTGVLPGRVLRRESPSSAA
ncbi:N-acyl-D-amino-acid deacylase family protein [Georgenia sp. MJ170]|uniref:N-acyl-D-amino-acid deacylase family protein n=1 Tax=Georgenia sunbinii TaxID=3117728 RepID=UPI002F265D89